MLTFTRIDVFSRAAEYASRQGWSDAAEDLQDAIDAHHRELAERGARSPEAMARALDPYDVGVDRAMVLADVWERR